MRCRLVCGCGFDRAPTRRKAASQSYPGRRLDSATQDHGFETRCPVDCLATCPSSRFGTVRYMCAGQSATPEAAYEDVATGGVRASCGSRRSWFSWGRLRTAWRRLFGSVARIRGNSRWDETTSYRAMDPVRLLVRERCTNVVLSSNLLPALSYGADVQRTSTIAQCRGHGLQIIVRPPSVELPAVDSSMSRVLVLSADCAMHCTCMNLHCPWRLAVGWHPTVWHGALCHLYEKTIERLALHQCIAG